MLLANQVARFFKIKYLRKDVNDEVSFWHEDDHLNIIYISLQYSQKNMRDQVDFLLANKHQHFLQIYRITLGVGSQAFPKYSK